MASSIAPIEVERKFQPPSDTSLLDGLVSEQGGEKLGEKAFTDTYFDTPDFSLTRRDCWLRRREAQWELKLPVDEVAKRSGGERTVFREIEGAAAVNAALQELLPSCGAELAETMAASGAQPFAEFKTARTKWKLGACTIDADVASFGHAVMEIERMCAERSEVAQAEAEIADVASLVGATPLKETGGKLETYIRRYVPDQFQALVEAGILRP